MCLGELLLKERLITVAQLEEGLRSQILYGARLGTNLVEIRAITLDQLGVALAKLHGVTVATERQFEKIDPRTAALLSAELAQQSLAIPLGITKVDRRLAVAFCDPGDQNSVAEVAFVTKMTVVPNAAPELRILFQLEKHYGITRHNRYLRVVQTPLPAELPEERRSVVPSMADLVSRSIKVPPPPIPRERPAGEASDGAKVVAPAGFSMPEIAMPPSRRGPGPSRPATPTPAAPPLAPVPPLVEVETVRAPRPAPVSTPVPTPTPTPAPAPEPAAPAGRQRAAIGAAETFARLATADSRDEIGELVVDYLRSAFGVGLTFIVKQEMALGWKGFAPGVDASRVEALALTLASPSIFRTAWESGATFRGALPAAGAVLHGHLLKLVKSAAPAEVIVCPISLKGRVINLVYAHAADGGLLPDSAVVDLAGVCAAVVTAFSRLIQAGKSPRSP